MKSIQKWRFNYEHGYPIRTVTPKSEPINNQSRSDRRTLKVKLVILEWLEIRETRFS